MQNTAKLLPDTANIVCLVIAGWFCQGFSIVLGQGEPPEEFALENIGHWREHDMGSAYGVVFLDNKVYLAAGDAGLVVVDVSDPKNPAVLSMTPIDGPALDLTVTNDLAFLAAGKSGLKILDITNPTNPQEIGSVSVSGTAWDVSVENGYAFLAASEGGLQIINVSEPAAPFWVGQYRTGGSAGGVRVNGNRVYLSDGNGGLAIFDVADPAKPALLGKFQPGGWADDVVLAADNTIFAVFTRVGVFHLDVSNPLKPVELARSLGTHQPLTAHLDGQRLFVSDYVGLYVYDVSERLRSPQSFFQSGPPVRDVTIAGNYAYLASTSGGLQILDLSDLAEIDRVGWLPAAEAARDVVLENKRAWVVSDWAGLVGLDVSDPSSPTSLLRYLPTDNARVTDLAFAGSIAFVAMNRDGAVLLDIDSPDAPAVRFHIADVSVTSVATAGSQLFLAWDSLSTTIERGFRIYDISNPAEPTLLSDIKISGLPTSHITVSGGRAYLSRGSDSILALDVTDLSAPREIKRIATPGFANRSFAHRGLLFVAAQSGGLQILNPSNIAAPQIVGAFTSGLRAYDVLVIDRWAFVAAGFQGLIALDVSDPTQPRQVAQVTIPGGANGLAADGQIIYVASGRVGMHTFFVQALNDQLIQISITGTASARVLELSNPNGDPLPPELLPAIGIETSVDLGQWVVLAIDGTWVSGRIEFRDSAFGQGPQRFYRPINKQ